MAGNRPHELRVKCPGCKVELIVDAVTGDVLRRVQADERPEDVFDDALDRARRNERSREDRFDRLMQSQEGRADRLDDAFERARRRAAEKDADRSKKRPSGD